MAFPTILVNSATGSDTTASGAGPGTAISGSTGRTRNNSLSTRFGFFGATDDFSGVATDGSAALFASISTAGARNFWGISAIKNTRQTGADAAITSGLAVLVVGSTSGWTANDLVKVAGAGAAGADYYSTIVTVDSAIQATMLDAAGTTVAGANWENPKQATMVTAGNTGTTDTAWAIGGKRASIGSTTSIKLHSNNSTSGDALPGWIVEMESGHAETLAATFNIRRAGDNTDGPIILRGTPGAGTPPIITFSNNGNGFILLNNRRWLQGFQIQNTNATKTASVAIGDAGTAVAQAVIERMNISDSTNKFWKGIVTTGGSDSWQIKDNDIRNCASTGIDLSGVAAGLTRILNNVIKGTAGHGIKLASISAAYVAGNKIIGNTLDGINGDGGNHIIVHNTIDANGSDGIEFSVAAPGGMLFDSNILSNNAAYGIKFSDGGATANLIKDSSTQMLNNCFYLNGTNKYLPTDLTISQNEVTTNPTYDSDYNVGSNMASLGYPLAGTTKVGGPTGLGYSYVDIGAAQIQPSAAGGGLLRHPGMQGGLNA